MKHSEHEQLFYDISAIKDIPILSVADALGISVQKRGNNHWCKVRDEKNPSVILHPERNSFYDFGNQVHGDVIRFVQYVKEFSAGAAIRYLGETFGLEPNMTRQELMDRPLTNWEYSRIGLHGDMATKNFVFPIETATTHELCEMASSFRIPLNTLQKQDPDIYRELIQKNAIPYVDRLRNRYFLDIWNYFHLVFALGDDSIRLYRGQKVRERFREDTKALNMAERILYRACKNASLEASEPPRHDPVEVIRRLLHGTLSISLGPIDSQTLDNFAQERGCDICSASVPFYSYFDDRLQSFSHSADYQSGRVMICYLSEDKAKLQPVLEEIQRIPDRPLEQMISEACERSSLASLNSQSTKEKLSHNR